MSQTMRMMHLFLGTDISVIYGIREQQFKDSIASYSVDQLAAQSLEAMTTQLTEECRIEIPVLHEDRIEMTEMAGEVPMHYVRPHPMNIDRTGTVQGFIYTLHIPYTGPQEAFYYKPPQYPLDMPAGRTTSTELLFTYSGADLSSEQINGFGAADLNKVKRQLESLRHAVAPFNNRLPGMIRLVLGARHAQAQKQRQTTAGIQWPIRKRPDAISIPVPPAIRKKVVAVRPATPTAAAEPVLMDEHYRHILNTIQNMSIAMERSPKAFARMEEEHLRFHFLMQLNGQYEGEALGEAFNYQGQTDILVRSGGHNLFIAECKFWGGEKVLLETTDQLFRYVTWRDTKTALIMFVKRKSFEGIVAEAQAFLQKHPLYVSGPTPEGATRFRYIFKHPSDSNQRVTVTLMLFHVNT